MVTVNEKDGYVTVNYNKFLKLSPLIARKLLEIISHFVTNCDDTRQGISPANFQRIRNSIMNREIKADGYKGHGSCCGCVLFHHDKTTFGIAKSVPKELRTFVKINPGQSVIWEKRFKLSLYNLDPLCESKTNESFYIRHMTSADLSLASQGIRKVKTMKLPHVFCRNGLPVIVVKKEGVKNSSWPVVHIPHLRVIDRQYGVKCTCIYAPQRALESFLDYIPEDKTIY